MFFIVLVIALQVLIYLYELCIVYDEACIKLTFIMHDAFILAMVLSIKEREKKNKTTTTLEPHK